MADIDISLASIFRGLPPGTAGSLHLKDMGGGVFAPELYVGGGAGAAVTVADGADVAEGATTAAAVVNPALAGSLIALSKGQLTELLALLAVEGATTDAAVSTDAAGSVNAHLRGLLKFINLSLPAALGQAAMAASLPAVLASNQTLAVLGTTTVTISSGQSLSGAVDLSSYALMRIVMPGAWTPAVLTVQTSPDGNTYNDVYDALGNEYIIAAAASRSILVPLSDFAGVRFIKLRSGTAGTPVIQVAVDRVITLITRPLL